MAEVPVDAIETEYVDDFKALNTLPAQDRQAGYEKLLDKILQDSVADRLEQNLIAYAAFLLQGGTPIAALPSSEPLGIIAARPLLSTFVTRLGQVSSPEVKASVAQSAIRSLQNRVVSFEESDTALKFILADAHQALEDFPAAARALQSIPLDSTQRPLSDTDKAQVLIRIARCYLEDDDTTNASTHINRAKNILHNVQSKELRLQFAIAQARILDSQRNFLDASSAYHNVSFEPLVDEEDRLQTLSAAIICAVLAPAGPQRARLLARLYKDDRAAQTDDYAILEKIFLDRVLSPDEVIAFASKLAPHQLASTADGSTVLDHAVLQHNLLGASKIYRNIRLQHLGALLGTGADRAESYAAQMIEQGRLRGHIDQIEGVIYFDGETTTSATSAPADDKSARNQSAGAQAQLTDGAGGSELRRWDAAVQSLLAEVENVTTMIQTADPAFYASHMAA